VRISVVQLSPGQDRARNIAQAGQLIDRAVAADRPDIVCLPEVWSCLGGSRATKFAQAEDLRAPEAPGSARAFLRQTARRHGIVVHGGSIIERDGERLFNTTLVYGPDGDELGRYRKIHLFDITAPDGTGYRESASFGGGDQVVVFPAGKAMLGCAICYDLRFAELFLNLRRAGAELIVLPSAFTRQTGEPHWEPLLRARAIETQCWIAAPATTGQHQDGSGEPRWTWGRSMILDPWGRIVARLEEDPGWVTAEMDRGVTERVRAAMPVEAHRRLAVPVP
jgi:deaminated glutathione amidase